MPHPTVEELATVLCKDAEGALVFRPEDIERLRKRALEETDRGLFTVVTELLDFAAYLEVCQHAPYAALGLYASMVVPLAEALQTRSRAAGLHEERADELSKRVRSEQQALGERHPLSDGFAPRPNAGAGVSLRPRSTESSGRGNNQKR